MSTPSFSNGNSASGSESSTAAAAPNNDSKDGKRPDTASLSPAAPAGSDRNLRKRKPTRYGQSGLIDALQSKENLSPEGEPVLLSIRGALF